MTHTVAELVSRYREHAVEHGAATRTGNRKKANKHHDQLVEAMHALRNRAPDGLRPLLGLFGDEDASVRCWAASHCLSIDEVKARKVLEDASAEPGILGFNARMVLSEWDKGELRDP